VTGCAIALQDYRDPALLGDVLDRLEQVGRLDSAGKMPWISAPLLDAFMKTACSGSANVAHMLTDI